MLQTVKYHINSCGIGSAEISVIFMIIIRTVQSAK